MYLPSSSLMSRRLIKKFAISNSGLEADQRVLTAHGVYSLTATTGLTAQNTLGVQDIHIVPSEFVRKQINAALNDVGADVVKLGEIPESDVRV